MSIKFIKLIEIGQDLYRKIFVKENPPIEIAYQDTDDESQWTVVDNFLDKDDEATALNIYDRELMFLGTKKGKIYRSIDRAESWQCVEDGVFFNGPYIRFMFAQLFEGDLVAVYANNEKGLLVSNDNGDTWDVAFMPTE